VLYCSSPIFITDQDFQGGNLLRKRAIRALPALLIITAFVMLFAAPAFAEDDSIVEFQGRKIDLKPYFEGYPYSGFTPDYDAGRMFYYYEGETTEMRMVRLGNMDELDKGQKVSDIDFSKRNVWGKKYNPRDKYLYWYGDEKNDEIINLYRLDRASRTLTKLTDVPYIYGWNWDRDKKRVAFVARTGHREERSGDLRLRDLEKNIESVVHVDDAGYRFTWTSVSWQEYGQGVALTVLKDADRAFGNIAYFDFHKRELKVLTDASKPRNWPSPLELWVSPTEFVFTSNEDGFRNAYKANVETGNVLQLTKFKRDIGDAEVLGFDGRRWLVCIVDTPIDNTLFLVNPHDGTIIDSSVVDVNLGILTRKGNKMFVSATSATVKYRIDELHVDERKGRGFKFNTKLSIPEDLEKQILHAGVEKIEYPTFDKDPATGETRMLHAFLYRPKNPQPAEKAVVMIQSFYGGGNYWSTRNQILAEAGIYVLSPSPRGSSGFGREFAALNDKDLGGNEIIDVIYAAKWAEKTLGVPPERIGVFGGSHGGYATMRLLTFPGEINGHKADFDWGFGISHAGFSDIIQFYEYCNIPDWVILEAGDPETEEAKLNDRSPINHADKGRGMLLLTHGTNDSRVPIEGSRAMADSLNAYGKDVELVEFEGQGHGIKGLANQVRFYKTWFEFLETVTSSSRASN